MASSSSFPSPPAPEPAILTLPADVLKDITDKLDPASSSSLKQTCKRMKFLVAQPPPLSAAHHFLGVGPRPEMLLPSLPPRDGRSTPVPQSPLPYKAAQTLQELESENRAVEERERERGMEVSDSDDNDSQEEEDGDAHSTVGSEVGTADRRPLKFKGRKGKKNILHWTAEMGQGGVPLSPGMHSPVALGEKGRLPSFTLTTSTS